MVTVWTPVLADLGGGPWLTLGCLLFAGQCGPCKKRGHMAGTIQARAECPSKWSPHHGAMKLRLVAEVRNGYLGEACGAGPTQPHVLLNLTPETWGQKVLFHHKMKRGSRKAGSKFQKEAGSAPGVCLSDPHN